MVRAKDYDLRLYGTYPAVEMQVRASACKRCAIGMCPPHHYTHALLRMHLSTQLAAQNACSWDNPALCPTHTVDVVGLVLLALQPAAGCLQLTCFDACSHKHMLMFPMLQMQPGSMTCSIQDHVSIHASLHLRWYCTSSQYERREEGYAALGAFIDGDNADGVRFNYTQPVTMVYSPDGTKAMQMFLGSQRGADDDQGSLSLAALPAPKACVPDHACLAQPG